MALAQPPILLSDLTVQLAQLTSQRDELVELVRMLTERPSTRTSVLAPVSEMPARAFAPLPAAVTGRRTRRTQRDYDYFFDLDLALQKLEGGRTGS
jgi:hypothetical protein